MLTKYADAEIVEITPVETSDLKKIASFEHLPEETFRTNDGYMYVKVRAISSRVNKNNDGWPVQELAGMHEPDFRNLVSKLDAEDTSVTLSSEKVGRVLTSNNVETKGEYGFKTFSGRPIFVDHNNTDPRRARGAIVDSLLYIEPSTKKYASDSYWSSSPDNHSPETWIELLLEVDAKSFPKLAKQIKEGKINAVSMGCNVDHTKCSICGNEAVTTHDYCDHIKRKGIKHVTAAGETKIAYEDCYGVNFFEISFVFDPADVTALTTGPIIAKTANDSMFWDDNDQQASKIDPTSGDKDWLKGLGIGWESNSSDDAYNRARVYGQKYAESIKTQLTQDPNLKYTLPVDDPEFFEMMKEEVKAGPDVDDSKLREFFLQGFKGSMGDAPETDPMEMQFNTSPSGKDHDWMMDNGIKWAKTADTVAPSKIDTLRQEAECPFKINQCGMDESGQCDVCGYNKPPEGFDDPDIDKAKANQKKIDQVRENEDLDQAGVAIKLDDEDSDGSSPRNNLDRVKRMKQILTNKQSRQINVQTKENESEAMNKESQIILKASVEETPSDEKLQSLGWVVDAAPEVPAAEDGKKATDNPRDQKVVEDQLAPVEAATKESMGESQLMVNQGDQTPQYQNFGTKPIKEHNPGSDPKAPKPTHSDGTQTKAEESPQFSGPGGNFPTEGIKEHQPGEATQNSYPTPGTGPNGGNGAEGAPQFTTEDTGGKFLDQDGISEHHPGGIPSNPSESKSSAHLFNSMKLAELEIELGLINGETKYARVAELESSASQDVITRLNALSSVKEAGLKKHVEPVVAKTSIPSFRSSGTTASEVLPDEAIFA